MADGYVRIPDKNHGFHHHCACFDYHSPGFYCYCAFDQNFGRVL
jgi:hypothetical protein